MKHKRYEDVEIASSKKLKTHGTEEQTANGKSNIEGKKRRKRVRVKKLHQDLVKQMEFYFSDANLRKDRYMKELVTKDEKGWVEVHEFLKFNRISQLLASKGLSTTPEISKAIKKSKILEVSDDMMRIRRNAAKFPLKLKNQTEVDDCTVYIQGLQQGATIEGLRSLFSEFGPVEYASIPRKRSGEHKGFAFIEFAEKTGAENTCKFYNLKNGGTAVRFIRDHHERTNSSPIGGELANMANLKVISKTEWLQHKEHYLQLKKQKAKLAKQFLSTFKSASAASVVQPKENDEEQAKLDQQKEQGGLHLIEVELDEAKLESETAEATEQNPSFQTGCIMKVEATEPLKKADKILLHGIKDVLYVDVMENDPTAYLRFGSAQATSEFLNNNGSLDNRIHLKTRILLDGEEEQQYWQRVELMRIKKRSRIHNRIRGRQKLQERYDKRVAVIGSNIQFNKRIVFAD